MLFNILLQAPAGGGSAYTQLIMFGLIFVIFYFFMIRPQQKKAKEQKAFLETLKPGDKVITMSGLHGTLVEVRADVVEIEIARGVKITHDRNAISVDGTRRLNAPATPAK